LKHVARLNKSECAKVRVLCPWIGTVDDWLTQWDDVAQIHNLSCPTCML